MTEQENWQTADEPNANADEWREVESEVQIKVDTMGDGWMGRFMGMDPRNDNGIIQAHFTNITDLDGLFIADSAFTNATRDLEQKLKKVPVKSMTRIQWTSSLNTGHESGTPMRVFTVQWK